jgi:5'-nucleotidase
MADSPLILITNDDGIESPGLRAAIEAALPLGEVLVAAPHEQQTGAGRSFIKLTDRRIYHRQLTVGGQTVKAFSIKGTPAQATLVALLDLMPRRPSLVISGINFGANVGSGITISGTVGAALEAAAHQVPALAVSLDTPVEYHISHSEEIDFSTAAHFTRYFADRVLHSVPFPVDVDVMKVDVPAQATPDTEWRMTFVSRQRYIRNHPSPPEERGKWVQTTYETWIDKTRLEPGSDVWAVFVDGVVAVSPLSLDLTARVDLIALVKHLEYGGLHGE